MEEKKAKLIVCAVIASLLLPAISTGSFLVVDFINQMKIYVSDSHVNVIEQISNILSIIALITPVIGFLLALVAFIGSRTLKKQSIKTLALIVFLFYVLSICMGTILMTLIMAGFANH